MMGMRRLLDSEPLHRAREAEQQAARQQERRWFARLIHHLNGSGHAGGYCRAAERHGGRCRRGGRDDDQHEHQYQKYLHFLTRCPPSPGPLRTGPLQGLSPDLHCNHPSRRHPIRMHHQRLIPGARVVQFDRSLRPYNA